MIEDTIYVFGGGSTYNKAPKTTPVECYSSEAGAWARKGEIKSRFVTFYQETVSRIRYTLNSVMLRTFECRGQNATKVQ